MRRVCDAGEGREHVSDAPLPQGSGSDSSRPAGTEAIRRGCLQQGGQLCHPPYPGGPSRLLCLPRGQLHPEGDCPQVSRDGSCRGLLACFPPRRLRAFRLRRGSLLSYLFPRVGCPQSGECAAGPLHEAPSYVRESFAFVRTFQSVGQCGVRDAEDSGEEPLIDSRELLDNLADSRHLLPVIHCRNRHSAVLLHELHHLLVVHTRIIRVCTKTVLGAGVGCFAGGAMGEGFEVGVAGAGEEFLDEIGTKDTRGRDYQSFARHHPAFWQLHAGRKVGAGEVGRERLSGVIPLLVREGQVEDVTGCAVGIIEIVACDTVVQHVAEVIADAVFDVFEVAQWSVLEGSGAQSPVDIVPAVVVLGDAEAEVPFETCPVALIAKNPGEMEVTVQDFSRQYLCVGSFSAEPQPVPCVCHIYLVVKHILLEVSSQVEVLVHARIICVCTKVFAFHGLLLWG